MHLEVGVTLAVFLYLITRYGLAITYLALREETGKAKMELERLRALDPRTLFSELLHRVGTELGGLRQAHQRLLENGWPWDTQSGLEHYDQRGYYSLLVTTSIELAKLEAREMHLLDYQGVPARIKDEAITEASARVESLARRQAILCTMARLVGSRRARRFTPN